MEVVVSQICVHAMQAFMERHVTENVLLISGALTATMTASVRMEQNVIHEQVLVPAPLGGRGWFVKSHVTKVTMVSNVKNSVNA